MSATEIARFNKDSMGLSIHDIEDPTTPETSACLLAITVQSACKKFSKPMAILSCQTVQFDVCSAMMHGPDKPIAPWNSRRYSSDEVISAWRKNTRPTK